MKRSRIKDFFWRHSAGIAFIVMLAFVALIGFVGWTYVVITKKFDSSRRWDLPSRVYSDATALVPGLAYPKALLEPKLNYTGYREVEGKVAQPGEYRYIGEDLEIYLQNFVYPDMEFHAMPVLVDFDGSSIRAVKRINEPKAFVAEQRFGGDLLRLLGNDRVIRAQTRQPRHNHKIPTCKGMSLNSEPTLPAPR